MAGNKTRTAPTWSEVKAKLAPFDRDRLVGLLSDLHSLSRDNQAFLHARLGYCREAKPFRAEGAPPTARRRALSYRCSRLGRQGLHGPTVGGARLGGLRLGGIQKQNSCTGRRRFFARQCCRLLFRALLSLNQASRMTLPDPSLTKVALRGPTSTSETTRHLFPAAPAGCPSVTRHLALARARWGSVNTAATIPTSRVPQWLPRTMEIGNNGNRSTHRKTGDRTPALCPFERGRRRKERRPIEHRS